MIEKKVVPEKVYLAAKNNLTIAEIATFAEEIIPQLYMQLAASSLEAAGPIEFIYHGINGNPETKFDLHVAIPIKAKGKPQEKFLYYHTRPFSCAYTDYHGSMAGIKDAWTGLVESVFQAGITPTEQCREVYKKWAGLDSSENITELQVGL